jgi:hypothetical protein
LRRTPELESLSRAVRRLCNQCRRDRNPQCWETYRVVQRRCREKLMKASKVSWMTSCNSVNDLPTSARLHRTLSRVPEIKLGSLVAPSTKRKQSEGETLRVELLLASRFPSSTVTVETAIPAAACGAKRCDWRVAARFVP